MQKDSITKANQRIQKWYLRTITFSLRTNFGVSGTSFAFFSKSNRILILTIFLTSVLVYNFYTTFLISTLTVNKLTLPFENLQELYERRTFSFGFSGGGALDNFFKACFSPHPLHFFSRRFITIIFKSFVYCQGLLFFYLQESSINIH